MRTSTLNWLWVATAILVPTLIGVLAALPFWRRADPAFGSAIGAGVALAGVMLLFGREFLELMAFEAACKADDVPCRSRPGAFMRGAIYAFVAFGDVALVYLAGLLVSERRRRREVWRRTLNPQISKSETTNHK